MLSAPRSVFASLAAATLLSLALVSSAVAQVATLSEPDTDADESPLPVAAAIEGEEALLAFAQCMRDNGIEMDDPEPGQNGVRGFFGGGPGGGDDGIDRRSPEFQASQQACGDILEASRPEVDPEAEQERLEEQLALAQCIRDAGYDEYPDPAIGSDGRLERVRGQEAAELGFDRRSPEFQEALGGCRDEMGLEGGFGGGFGQGPGNGGN